MERPSPAPRGPAQAPAALGGAGPASGQQVAEAQAASAEQVAAALADAEHQLERLGVELGEIEMLEQQARTEAARHEQRRGQLADRLATMQARGDGDPGEIREAVTQLATLARRAATMDAQVDVLVGKQRVLVRYRDHLARLVPALRAAAEWAPQPAGEAGADALTAVPAQVSRAILAAQEDMRRDIARSMHDGPAQSLANIVLQAQIVEHLVQSDPDAAVREAGALVGVVQHALDETKTFIFNVRPMVLDDLGLVPTLRRLARDRGREAGVPIAFDSMGADRRLDVELEATIFRIMDEATAGYASRRPSRIEALLTWEPDAVAGRVEAVYVGETALEMPPQAGLPAPADPAAVGRREQGEDLPPALAAMIRERDEEAVLAREAATAGARRVERAEHGLPAATWRDVEQRARSLGIAVSLVGDGRVLELNARA